MSTWYSQEETKNYIHISQWIWCAYKLDYDNRFGDQSRITVWWQRCITIIVKRDTCYCDRGHFKFPRRCRYKCCIRHQVKILYQRSKSLKFLHIKSAVMVYTCISQVKYLILYCNGQKSSFLYLSYTFFRWKWQWISKKDLVNKSHKFYLLTFFLKNKKCAEQTFILTINICCRVNWFNDIQKGDLCF